MLFFLTGCGINAVTASPAPPAPQGAAPEGTSSVYLRDPYGGPSCQIVDNGVSDPTPATNDRQVVTCASPHGWSAGQVVIIYHVQGTAKGAGWCANGVRKVADPITSQSFAITDVSGANIPACGASGPNQSCLSTGTPCPPNPSAPKLAYAAPAKGYILNDHPRVVLDGPDGKLTNSLASLSGACPKPSNCNPAYQALMQTYNQYAPVYSNLRNASAGGFFFADFAAAYLASGSSDSAALTAARFLIDNPDILSSMSVWCQESMAGLCGADQGGDIDYSTNTQRANIATYEMIYSQLTPDERQKFADYMLNDLSQNADGLGIAGDPNTSCTPVPNYAGPGTITVSGTSLTGSGTSFDSSWVNNVIYPVPAAYHTHAVIVSVEDATHATLDRSVLDSYSGQWTYSRRWTQSSHDCGITWLTKHHMGAIFADPMNYVTGGLGGYGVSNQTYTKVTAHLATGLSLCGQDQRGCTLAAMASAFLFDHVLSYAAANYSHGHAGYSYDAARTERFHTQYALWMKNSVQGYPDVGLNIAKDFMYEKIFNSLQYAPPNYPIMQYDEQGDDYLDGHGSGMSAFANDLALYSGTADAMYGAYWLTNIAGGVSNWNFNSGTQGDTRWETYIAYDPNQSRLPLPSTQYLFHPRSTSACSTYSLMCSQYQYPRYYVVSRTGWAPTSTVVHMLSAPSRTGDHGDQQWCAGCLRLYKGGPLLAGDSSGMAGSGAGYTSLDANDGEKDNQIEIGDSEGNWAGMTNCPTSDAFPTISRWAGTDPTGDATSRYAYWMDDLTTDYCSSLNVARAWKHVVHFKEGPQDYVVRYFDGGMSSGASQFREFIHYRIKNDQGTAITCAAGAGAQCVTVPASNQVTLQSTSANNRLNEAILNTSGANSIYFLNPTATAPGALGSTVRSEVGSSTDGATLGAVATAEWAIVDQPCTGTSCSLPAISQPACTGGGGSCTAISIQDPNVPKVAVFARQGALLTSVQFTSTHAGIGQYVIAGLVPGTYSITVGGIPVAGSPFTVRNADNSVYFESRSGSVAVTMTAAAFLFITPPNSGSRWLEALNASFPLSHELNELTLMRIDDDWRSR